MALAAFRVFSLLRHICFERNHITLTVDCEYMYVHLLFRVSDHESHGSIRRPEIQAQGHAVHPDQWQETVSSVLVGKPDKRPGAGDESMKADRCTDAIALKEKVENSRDGRVQG